MEKIRSCVFGKTILTVWHQEDQSPIWLEFAIPGALLVAVLSKLFGVW